MGRGGSRRVRFSVLSAIAATAAASSAASVPICTPSACPQHASVLAIFHIRRIRCFAEYFKIMHFAIHAALATLALPRLHIYTHHHHNPRNGQSAEAEARQGRPR